MIEAISSIIYASQRVSDMQELGDLRSIFASKYGRRGGGRGRARGSGGGGRGRG